MIMYIGVVLFFIGYIGCLLSRFGMETVLWAMILCFVMYFVVWNLFGWVCKSCGVGDD